MKRAQARAGKDGRATLNGAPGARRREMAKVDQQSTAGDSAIGWRWQLMGLVGGMGASSCCVVQLLLNALGFGCAGFAVLDPLRPLLLTFSACTLLLPLVFSLFCSGSGSQSKCGSYGGSAAAEARTAHCGSGKWKFNGWRFALHATIVIALALSPEILRMYDSAMYDSLYSRGTSKNYDLVHGVHPNPNLEPAAIGLILLRTSGVKCEGCRHRVKSALATLPGVIATEVVLDADGDLTKIFVDLNGHSGTGNRTGPSDEDLARVAAAGKFEAAVVQRTTVARSAISLRVDPPVR